MAKLRALWRGDLPLGEAFWTYAVSLGLVLNLLTTLLFLMLLSWDRPIAALFVGHAFTVPYNSSRWSGCGGRPRATRASAFMPTSPASSPWSAWCSCRCPEDSTIGPRRPAAQCFEQTMGLGAGQRWESRARPK